MRYLIETSRQSYDWLEDTDNLQPTTYLLLPNTHHLISNTMPEQPTIQSPESDLARGLAEFRQGRKSLLPEFELPTDNLPKEEQSEVCPERLTVYTFEQLLKGLNVEERLKDPGFLIQLTKSINDCLKLGKTNPAYASWACQSLSAIRSLGINLPELNPEKLITKINNDPSFLELLTKYLNERFKWGKTDPDYASWACETLSVVRSLGINLPELNSEELIAKITNDPSFLEQITKHLNNRFERGKTNPDDTSYACRTLSAVRSLGINLPGLNPEELITKITNDPSFLEQLTEYLNDRLEQGKITPDYTSYTCWTLSAIQNIIKYHSAIADEKEVAQAAEKLKTAADRTGVPPRPETKAF